MDTHTKPAILVLALLTALLPAACGGGAAASIDGQSVGQGLILVEFSQSGQDNVPLNRALEFHFSEPVDPASVSTGAIQIREGPSFGVAAAGRLRVSGTLVRFEPRLPTTCGKSAAAFKPGQTYRVTLLGFPEELAVVNTQGQSLDRTRTFEFETLPESDPDHLEDQIPGLAPEVLAATPADGTAAVSIDDTLAVEVRFSENLDPCTIIENQTVRATVHEFGDIDTHVASAGGNISGFDPIEDSVPGDPKTWGGNATALANPVRLDVALFLEQDFASTLLRIAPRVGRFPENCLVVVELTSGIRDFGGMPLAYRAVAFTTENLPRHEENLVLEFDDGTPMNDLGTNADVNTVRSPGRAQAWLAFGGDGDNGLLELAFPSWPQLAPSGAYLACEYRENDGEADAFDPADNVTLNTGSTPLPIDCTNQSDGSGAVVWEFESFRIRGGVTVRLTGVNPAIILVRGDVVIETGGVLWLAGGAGTDSGNWNASAGSGARAGGRAIAGGGQGGSSISATQAIAGTPKSRDGFAAVGSPEFDPLMVQGGPGEGGEGGGQGGSTSAPSSCTTTGGAQGGGGGGHAASGQDAGAIQPANSTWDLATVGRGGNQSPIDATMPTPSAGAGGGAGGSEASTAGADESSGGAGGAGGGFVGITANGSIRIYGTIDASGGRGGRGGWDPDGSCNGANAGGGGGGAGGGIRLLCPGEIDVSGGTLTAAGGAPGLSGASSLPPSSGPVAGAGAPGRIVLEDGDSIVTGMGTALLVPSEGEQGFYRARLDPSRFVTGSTVSTATTEAIALGAILRPDLVTFHTLTPEDLLAGIPEAAGQPGLPGIVVEIQGFVATPLGEVDQASGTGWYTIGYMEASGDPTNPTWNPDDAPPDFTPEAGIGIANLDGRAAFVQVRLTFLLQNTMGPEDPGPYVDRMTIRFDSDA